MTVHWKLYSKCSNMVMRSAPNYKKTISSEICILKQVVNERERICLNGLPAGKKQLGYTILQTSPNPRWSFDSMWTALFGPHSCNHVSKCLRSRVWSKMSTRHFSRSWICVNSRMKYFCSAHGLHATALPQLFPTMGQRQAEYTAMCCMEKIIKAMHQISTVYKCNVPEEKRGGHGLSMTAIHG